MKLSQNGAVKLSASLGSISPTRKSFSAFTGQTESRRRSDDNCKLDDARDFPFESDSENEVPSDLSSSSDGLRHHSRNNRLKPPQRKHYSSRRHTEDGQRLRTGNGSINGGNSVIHISRSPNVNRKRQECQNLVPLQHSPQRHRGSTILTPDERRNMLLNSLVQDFSWTNNWNHNHATLKWLIFIWKMTKGILFWIQTFS